MTNSTAMIPLIAFFVWLDAGGATLHKCTNANGKIEYSDRPCSSGTTAQKITVRDNTAGAGESMESIRAKDAALNARQEARRQQEDALTAERLAEDLRRYEADREHQDRRDLIDAVRPMNKPSGLAYPQWHHRPAPMPAAAKRPEPPPPAIAIRAPTRERR